MAESALNAIDRSAVERWIGGYERAWRTAGTAPLAMLYTDDATYSMQSYDQPVRGLAAIAELWERERNGSDERFTMTHELVAVEGDTGVARVEVHYADGERSYRDLWIIRFAGARCRAFEEWPFWPTQGVGRDAAA